MYKKEPLKKYFTKCNGSESVLQIDDYAVIDDVYFYKELNLLKDDFIKTVRGEMIGK